MHKCCGTCKYVEIFDPCPDEVSNMGCRYLNFEGYVFSNEYCPFYYAGVPNDKRRRIDAASNAT